MGLKSTRRGGTDLGTKLSATVGVAAALVLAVLVNLLAARRYERWDLTSSGRFTLSPATLETLGKLGEPVRVIVILSKNDPLGLSVHQLLEAYRAESTQLSVDTIDPDRDRAELFAAQQKYGLLTGERDGRVVTDVVIVVVRGDRRHFISASELVEVEPGEEARAKPRLEHAITGALRAVSGGEVPRVCFTSGHGEHSIDEGGEMGLAALRSRLEKNNYEVTSVFGDEEASASLDGCSLLVVAAPSQAVPKPRVEAMRRFVAEGGSALVVAGPIPDEADRDFAKLGLDELISLAGVALERDFIFELDPAARSTGGQGETFYAQVEMHPATESIAGRTNVVLTAASGLRDLGTATKPEVLLRTSERAFGMVDFFAWAQAPGPPRASDRDHPGPLTVAVAAELPKPASSKREHGPRVVVVSALNPLFGGNWASADHRGTAAFVEGSITWLAAHRRFLDIPDKPSSSVGLRLSEEAISSVFRFSVVALPTIVTIFGALVYQARRRRPGRKGTGPGEGGAGGKTERSGEAERGGDEEPAP